MQFILLRPGMVHMNFYINAPQIYLLKQSGSIHSPPNHKFKYSIVYLFFHFLTSKYQKITWYLGIISSNTAIKVKMIYTITPINSTKNHTYDK